MVARKVNPRDRTAALRDARAIGARMRKLRTEQGHTTVSLARKLRISQAQVSRLENGLQAFRSNRLIQIARVLNVPPTYFMAGGGEDTVVRELETAQLTPSKTLRTALRNKGFLNFVEFCARAQKTHKKALVRMGKAVGSVIRGTR